MERRTLLKAAASLPLLRLPVSTPTQRLNNLSVVVLGAGAFGGWTALKLIEQGANVTIVDPWGPGNARASSGGESRVIRSVYGTDRIYTEWVKRSFDHWRQLEQDSHQTVYHPTGLLWMFSEPDDYIRDSKPIALEFGFEVDEITLDDGQQRYPCINFEGLESLFFEQTAGHLMARHACHVVCNRAQQLGARYVQAATKPLAELNGTIEKIELTDGSHLEADQFVIACGPWLATVLPDVIGEKIQPTRQEVHYFGYPANETASQLRELPIWVDFGERLYYGIPETERRGFKIADDTRGPNIDPTLMDRTPTQESIERSREFIARRFPALADAPLIESRVCQYENSPDGQFIIDQHPDSENVWIVGGGSGHGFKLSPAVGEFLAQRIAGEADHEAFFELRRLDNASSNRQTQFDQDKEENE